MTVDTIFDAASLTKVIATTPSVMKLFEQGKLRLDDPVTKYLPEFQGGKSDITIRLLMTHFSGMPPDLELVPRWKGYQTGIERALVTKPIAPPGVRFIYSDINFILMGEIVRRVSGETLAEFAHEQIFAPLGMKDTEFQPDPSLRPRIAPTEIDEDTGQPFRGVVHDPTSRYMGGIAGHAGLFTTADDFARYAEMMLGMGATRGRAHLRSHDRAEIYGARQSRQTSRSSARSVGIWIRLFRVTAASSIRSAPMDTQVSRVLRFGWIAPQIPS